MNVERTPKHPDREGDNAPIYLTPQILVSPTLSSIDPRFRDWAPDWHGFPGVSKKLLSPQRVECGVPRSGNVLESVRDADVAIRFWFYS